MGEQQLLSLTYLSPCSYWLCPRVLNKTYSPWIPGSFYYYPSLIRLSSSIKIVFYCLVRAVAGRSRSHARILFKSRKSRWAAGARAWRRTWGVSDPVWLRAPGSKILSASLKEGNRKALKYSFFECKRSVLDASSRFRERKGYWYYCVETKMKTTKDFLWSLKQRSQNKRHIFVTYVPLDQFFLPWNTEENVWALVFNMYKVNDSLAVSYFWEKNLIEQLWGLPWWSSGKLSALQCRGRGFHPWSGN